jgi:hypothetical protein
LLKGSSNILIPFVRCRSVGLDVAVMEIFLCRSNCDAGWDFLSAEEKQGLLLVYDKDGAVPARFSLSKVSTWTGSDKKSDDF